MPIKLPQYNAQVNAQIGSGNVYANPDFLNAGIKDDTGKILQAAGNEGIRLLGAYEEKKESARKKVEAVTLSTVAMEDKTNFLEAINKDEDWQNIDSKLQEFTKTNMEKYKGMVKDPNDWPLYEAQIKRGMIETSVHTRAIKDNKMFREWELNYDNVVVPAHLKEYVATGNPEVLERLSDYSKQLMSVGAIKEGKANDFVALAKTGDLRRVENFLQEPNSINKWNSLNEEQKKTMFPYLDDRGLEVANEMAYKVEERDRVQQNRLTKEVHSKGAVATKEQYRAFKSGKNPKFENWLENAYANDQISDGTYSMFADKVFQHKETWSNKMTPGKLKNLIALEKEILREDSEIKDTDDLFKNKIFQSLPESKQESLARTLLKGGPIKNAIKRGNKIINESFTLSGVIDAVEKDDVRQLFRDSIEGIDDPKKIHDIARDIANGGIKPKAQGTTATTDKTKAKKVKTYNPLTGKFE